MPDPKHRPSRPRTPVAPKLPDVDSPPREDVLDGVPSTEQIVEQATRAEDIVDEQPSVDDVLGRRG